jgi:hypothetical protein
MVLALCEVYTRDNTADIDNISCEGKKKKTDNDFIKITFISINL